MKQLDLGGRVAVITGGAQGIGLAIAQRPPASGARVQRWDMGGVRLAQAVGELSDEAAVAAANAAARARHGRISTRAVFDLSGGRATY